MAQHRKAKPRAVRLTVDALEVLNLAIEESWRVSRSGKKLTRPARAELLGLSMPTVDRILNREGVDRSSLIEAFRSLDVPWSDQYCELEIEAQATRDIAKPQINRDKGVEPRRFGRPFVALGVVLLVASLALGALYQWPRGDWTTEYDLALKDASNLYYKGKYQEAEQRLAMAMAIGESKKTSRDLEAALKLQGDLAAARGRLRPAVEYYRATIRYRELRNSPRWATIHEALATIQIRLGEYQVARANLDIAEKAFSKNNEMNGIAEVLRDRGCLAAATGHSVEALEWFSRCLQLLATLNAPDLVVDVRGCRAMALLHLGRTKEAHSELEACLDYWTASGHHRWIGLSEWHLAQAEVKLGRRQSAIERLSRARELFVASGDEARISEVESFLTSLRSRR